MIDAFFTLLNDNADLTVKIDIVFLTLIMLLFFIAGCATGYIYCKEQVKGLLND